MHDGQRRAAPEQGIGTAKVYRNFKMKGVPRGWFRRLREEGRGNVQV